MKWNRSKMPFSGRGFFRAGLWLALIAGLFALKSTTPVYAVPSGMNLVWSDEFNQGTGNAPNSSTWGYDIGTGWGNNQLEYDVSSLRNCQTVYDSDSTDGQVLQFLAEVDSAGKWWSARITTQGRHSFGPYGYYEANAKLPSYPNAQGMWPAFWMLGTNIGSVGWPACGEIDIMEQINGQGAIYGSAHASGWDPSTEYGVSVWNYNTYGVNWQPTYLTYYVNGNAYATYTSNGAGSSWVFNSTDYIILNLAVGGNWPGSPNSGTYSPSCYRVDYVRQYEY
jgi:beta-glucanase (GH16 family)